MSDAAIAARALSLLDLTDLGEEATEAGALALCARALAPPVPVAAICVWPRFVAAARRALGDGPVRIATVVNFPEGSSAIAPALRETEAALADGADEIDLVLPWGIFLTGYTVSAKAMVSMVKGRCGDRLLKVILETGEYPDEDRIRAASELAIEAGADFIKTSTGKTPNSASLAAVRVMLAAIGAAERPVGIKPSGGIRTLADAKSYLALADAMMGENWVSPATFRFGASGLHQVLLDTIAGEAGGQASGPY